MIVHISLGIAALGALMFLALFVFVARLINRTVVKSVQTMKNPDGLLALIADGPSRLAESPEYRDWADWARDHGFAPDIMADFSGAEGGQIITVGVWRNRASKTYLATYATPMKVTSEFITMLEKDAALTTTNSKDSLTLPNAPGRYIQAFDGASLDEIVQSHHQGLEWIRQQKGLTPIERPETTDRLILDSVRRQMAYIKTLLCWKHRGAWWYLVRRARLNNKSIAERFGS